MKHPQQTIVLKELFDDGYEFCKGLPDNAPGQDLLFSSRAPTYLQKGGNDAIVVYHDGRTESYKPVYLPPPPVQQDTLDFD